MLRTWIDYVHRFKHEPEARGTHFSWVWTPLKLTYAEHKLNGTRCKLI